jgi:hypothetical protein
MEPDNDGSFGVAADDGSDEDAFDEPWGCLKPWESTNNKSTKSGSDDDSNNDVADIAVNKSKALDGNKFDHPIETDNVMQYDIAFTSSEYVEKKLLKVLNDAHAPHFLYQDVLNWAKEANKLKYDFLPHRTT